MLMRRSGFRQNHPFPHHKEVYQVLAEGTCFEFAILISNYYANVAMHGKIDSTI
jgi:hypothetical protein